MTSSHRLVLTDNAERDFRSILRYTRRQWGRQQRDTYADRLVATMHHGDVVRLQDRGPHDRDAIMNIDDLFGMRAAPSPPISIGV